LGGCWSLACSRDAAARLGAVLGWTEKQAAVELEGFERERSSFLHKPPQVNALLEAAAD